MWLPNLKSLKYHFLQFIKAKLIIFSQVYFSQDEFIFFDHMTWNVNLNQKFRNGLMVKS